MISDNVEDYIRHAKNEAIRGIRLYCKDHPRQVGGVVVVEGYFITFEEKKLGWRKLKNCKLETLIQVLKSLEKEHLDKL